MAMRTAADCRDRKHRPAYRNSRVQQRTESPRRFVRTYLADSTQSFAANPPSTFGQSGGVIPFAVGPSNCDTLGGAFYPGNPPLYALPCDINDEAVELGGSSRLRFVGGPPAYPFFNDGTFP